MYFKWTYFVLLALVSLAGLGEAVRTSGGPERDQASLRGDARKKRTMRLKRSREEDDSLPAAVEVLERDSVSSPLRKRRKKQGSGRLEPAARGQVENLISAEAHPSAVEPQREGAVSGDQPPHMQECRPEVILLIPQEVAMETFLEMGSDGGSEDTRQSFSSAEDLPDVSGWKEDGREEGACVGALLEASPPAPRESQASSVVSSRSLQVLPYGLILESINNPVLPLRTWMQRAPEEMNSAYRRVWLEVSNWWNRRYAHAPFIMNALYGSDPIRYICEIGTLIEKMMDAYDRAFFGGALRSYWVANYREIFTGMVNGVQHPPVAYISLGRVEGVLFGATRLCNNTLPSVADGRLIKTRLDYIACAVEQGLSLLLAHILYQKPAPSQHEVTIVRWALFPYAPQLDTLGAAFLPWFHRQPVVHVQPVQPLPQDVWVLERKAFQTFGPEGAQWNIFVEAPSAEDLQNCPVPVLESAPYSAETSIPPNELDQLPPPCAWDVDEVFV